MTPQALAPRRENLTLSGPFAGGKPEFSIPVKLGTKTYYMPYGCRIAHSSENGERIAYVLDREDLHCLSPEGEISIPEHLKPAILARYFAPS